MAQFLLNLAFKENNYIQYQKCIDLPTIVEVGNDYYKAISNLYFKLTSGKYLPSKLSVLNTIKIKYFLNLWRVKRKVAKTKKK